MPRVVAIDPPGCGCTECLTGEYVPLDQASDKQIRALAKGKLRNNTHTGRLVKKTILEDRYTGRWWPLKAKDLEEG